MNKRAYIFYLAIFIMGFGVAYLIGLNLGLSRGNNYSQQTINADTKEQSDDSAEGYWVKADENTIFVYKSDCKTVIAETDIDISEFSDKEKNILENGVYLENAEELFKYLEANTS